MKLFMLFLAVCFLNACVTVPQITQKYETKWLGHPINEAVSLYGAPQAVTDVDIGKVYQWHHAGPIVSSINSFQSTTTVATNQAYCDIKFTSDSTGNIIRVAWYGVPYDTCDF